MNARRRNIVVSALCLTAHPLLIQTFKKTLTPDAYENDTIIALLFTVSLQMLVVMTTMLLLVLTDQTSSASLDRVLASHPFIILRYSLLGVVYVITLLVFYYLLEYTSPLATLLVLESVVALPALFCSGATQFRRESVLLLPLYALALIFTVVAYPNTDAEQAIGRAWMVNALATLTTWLYARHLFSEQALLPSSSPLNLEQLDSLENMPRPAFTRALPRQRLVLTLFNNMLIYFFAMFTCIFCVALFVRWHNDDDTDVVLWFQEHARRLDRWQYTVLSADAFVLLGAKLSNPSARRDHALVYAGTLVLLTGAALYYQQQHNPLPSPWLLAAAAIFLCQQLLTAHFAATDADDPSKQY